MTSQLSEEAAVALSAFFHGASGPGPTHPQLTELFKFPAAVACDPGAAGGNKETRVRVVLSTLIRSDPEAALDLVSRLLAAMRPRGSFMEGSEHYPGSRTVAAARMAFERCGWNLHTDGTLTPLVISQVDQSRRRPAIEAQIERMRRASGDAALLIGTAKELLESTARYVLAELDMTVRPKADFNELLYLSRERLGLLPQQVAGDAPAAKAVREVFDGLWRVAKAVNELRNIEGTGHGRARLPGVPPETARAVVRAVAPMCELMLETLDTNLGHHARTA